MTTTKKNPSSFKVLSFKEKYLDFTVFYDLNKTRIYKSIVEIYKEFNNSKHNCLSLHIEAKINGTDWDTEFKFKRDETIILMRDVMPYFEKMEDYETCGVIKKLYLSLTNQ